MGTADFSTVDLVIESYLPIIAAAQTVPPSQLVWSHAVPPTLGLATEPDRLSVSPGHSSVAWLGRLPEGVPAAWRVAVCSDIYEAASASGFVARFAVMVDAIRYERAVDLGAGGYSHAWRAIE